MVELEKPACLAAGPVSAHEGALALVPLPDGTPDVRRDAALSHGGRALLRLAGCGSSELPLLELHDQSIERPVEHLGHISCREGMAEQCLGVPQLLVRALLDRDLNKEPLRRGALRHLNL